MSDDIWWYMKIADIFYDIFDDKFDDVFDVFDAFDAFDGTFIVNIFWKI